MITCKLSATFEDIRLDPLGEISMTRNEKTREASEMSFQYDPEQVALGEDTEEPSKQQDSKEEQSSENNVSDDFGEPV